MPNQEHAIWLCQLKPMTDPDSASCKLYANDLNFIQAATGKQIFQCLKQNLMTLTSTLKSK